MVSPSPGPLSPMSTDHISSDDLERYCLNRVTDGPELAVIQEHLLQCQHCVDRAEALNQFIALARAGVVRGIFEVDLLRNDSDRQNSRKISR